jgi:hypothetical protein
MYTFNDVSRWPCHSQSLIADLLNFYTAAFSHGKIEEIVERSLQTCRFWSRFCPVFLKSPSPDPCLLTHSISCLSHWRLELDVQLDRIGSSESIDKTQRKFVALQSRLNLLWPGMCTFLPKLTGNKILICCELTFYVWSFKSHHSWILLIRAALFKCHDQGGTFLLHASLHADMSILICTQLGQWRVFMQ